MVALNDMRQITELYQEFRTIDQAIGNLDTGGRIIQMSISSGPLGRMPVSVSTMDIEYPPQMVEAIKTVLRARQSAIRDELATLGVTEVPDAV